MLTLAALAQCFLAGVAAGLIWQAADLRRLHAQAEAAWQDLQTVRAARAVAGSAVQAAERYYAEVTQQYHRRLRHIPSRWVARLWRFLPREELSPTPTPARSGGPWA